MPVAGKLYDKFVGFAEDLERIGASINNARNAFEDARGKLSSGRGNLVRQAEELKKLGAKTSKKLPAPLLALGEDGVAPPGAHAGEVDQRRPPDRVEDGAHHFWRSCAGKPRLITVSAHWAGSASR